MKRYFVAVDIAASAQKVWALISDASSYAGWNSTVERLDGVMSPGATVTLYAKAMPNRPFKLTVKTFEPPRHLVLEGGAPLGLFVGTRRLELTPQGAGRCRFEMEEILHGPLSPLLARFIPDQQPTFDIYAADLKRRAERG